MTVGHTEDASVAAGTPGPAAAEAATPGPARDRIINGLLDYGVLIVLVGLIIYFSIASPYFLSLDNFLNIGIAVAVNGTIAAGMTIALVAGQLDLSVGSVIGLTTVIVAGLHSGDHFSYPAAIGVALGAAILIGLVNGVLVVNIGINSIIATLATTIVVGAIALVIANGQTIPLSDDHLSKVVNANWLGVPAIIYVMALVYALGYVLLMRTKLGWHLYAAGGNASAARRTGIRVGALYRLVFLISAVLAVVAGVITTGQSSSGSGTYGADLQFDVLAAVLLGGIGLNGGGGRIERTLIGVLLVGVVNNGLVLTNVTSYYQSVALGIIFVAAVVMGALRQKRMAR